MKLTQPRSSPVHGPAHLKTMTDRQLTDDELKMIIGRGSIHHWSDCQTVVLTGQKPELNYCL